MMEHRVGDQRALERDGGKPGTGRGRGDQQRESERPRPRQDDCQDQPECKGGRGQRDRLMLGGEINEDAAGERDR